MLLCYTLFMQRAQSQIATTSQNLFMSTQLLQAIELLSLTSDELESRIFEEIEKNPALELAPTKSQNTKLQVDGVKNAQNFFDDNTWQSEKTGQSYKSDAFSVFLENQMDESETLQDYLLLQLHLLRTPDDVPQDVYELAEKIIQNTDEHGYFVEPVENLLEEKSCAQTGTSAQNFTAQKNTGAQNLSAQTGASTQNLSAQKITSAEKFATQTSYDAQDLSTKKIDGTLERALKLAQSFEPVGVCCKNLQESLLLQARAKPSCPELVQKILTEHFAELAHCKASFFKKKYPAYKEAQIQSALDFIRSLDPHPAQAFIARGKDSVQYCAPDVYVYCNKNDLDEPFTVVLADENLPVPRLSKYFKDLSNQSDETDGKANLDDSTAKYVQAKITDAKRFLSALDYRKKNILRVVKEIAFAQKAFFLGASDAPKPLKLSTVAQNLSLHESTVSRIANSKYLQCDRGLYPIKYFFPRSISASTVASAPTSARANDARELAKQNTSKEAVLLVMQQIIAEHSAMGKTLSDNALAKLLEERGMSVARRTVAKYRSILNIASSYDR